MQNTTNASYKVVEKVRGKLELIEIHRRAIIRQLTVEPTHPAHQIAIDQFIKAQLDIISELSDDALDTYEEPEQLQNTLRPQNSITSTTTAGGEGDAVPPPAKISAHQMVNEFEKIVAEKRRYHHDHPQPDWKPTVISLSLEAASDEFLPFRDEERMGKCLDLKDHHLAYVNFFHDSTDLLNSRGESDFNTEQKPLGWLDYVKQIHVVFVDPKLISKKRKIIGIDKYSDTVMKLLNYLRDFHRKVKPLEQDTISAVMEDDRIKFESQWAQGSSRDWLIGVKREDEGKVKAVALAELQITGLLAKLGEIVSKTVEMMISKSTRNVEEVRADAETDVENFRLAFEEANAKAITTSSQQNRGGAGGPSSALPQVGSSSTMKATDYQGGYTEEEQKKYGAAAQEPFVDGAGNVVPKWKRKLDQIDRLITCEVCGGEQYRGPKMYEEHFSQERHAEGLRALGIPEYRPYLALASTPEDVLRRAKLQREMIQDRIMTAGDEEVEDHDGNVFTRRGLDNLHRNISRR